MEILRAEISAVLKAGLPVHAEDADFLSRHGSSSSSSSTTSSKAAALQQLGPWGPEGRVHLMLTFPPSTPNEIQLMTRYMKLQHGVFKLPPKQQVEVQCVMRLPLERQFTKFTKQLAWLEQLSDEGDGNSRWFSVRSPVASFGVERLTTYFMEEMGVHTLPVWCGPQHYTYFIESHLLFDGVSYHAPSEVTGCLKLELGSALLPFGLLAGGVDALVRIVSASLQRNTSSTTFNSTISTCSEVASKSTSSCGGNSSRSYAASPSLPSANSNGSGSNSSGWGGHTSSDSLLAATTSLSLPGVHQPLRQLMILGGCQLFDVQWADSTGVHMATVDARDYKLPSGQALQHLDATIVRVHAVPGLWYKLPLAAAAATAAAAMALVLLPRGSTEPTPFKEVLQLYEQQLRAVSVTPHLLTKAAAHGDQAIGVTRMMRSATRAPGTAVTGAPAGGAGGSSAGVGHSASEGPDASAITAATATASAVAGPLAGGAGGSAGSRKVQVLSSGAPWPLSPVRGRKHVVITTPPKADLSALAAVPAAMEEDEEQDQMVEEEVAPGMEVDQRMEEEQQRLAEQHMLRWQQKQAGKREQQKQQQERGAHLQDPEGVGSRKSTKHRPRPKFADE